MTTSAIIVALIIVAFGASAYLLWQSSNSKGVAARQRIEMAERAARHKDQRKLSKQETEVLKRAKTLAKQGQPQLGAQILEQVGLQRDAISLLEENNLIEDAARILIKMQRPNRAAVIFARHGKWHQAAEQFKAAGMDIEAAKCYREGERYEDAAAIFKGIGKDEEAATCLALAKQWQPAGRLFLKSKQTDKAIISYDKLFQDQGRWSSLEFDQYELAFFKEQILVGRLNPGFVDALVRAGALLETIKLLIIQNRIVDAASLYTRSPTDLGPLLMSDINIQAPEGRQLGALFLSVSHFRHAGMVFEQMGDYRESGLSFEKAEMYDRAAYCFERCNDLVKANEMRSKHTGDKSSSNQRSHSFEASNEKTEVIGGQGPTPKSLPAGHIQNFPPVVGKFVLEVTETREQQSTHLEHDRALFHKCTFFADLDFEQRLKIWNISTIQEYLPSEVIVPWDEEPKGLYIVLDGEIDCLRRQNGQEVHLDPLKSGQVFGELWLLAEQPTTVKFIANQPARLLITERTKFTDLLDREGAIARKVYKRFTHRLLSKILNPQKSEEKKAAS